jgi:hypothetical protein
VEHDGRVLQDLETTEANAQDGSDARRIVRRVCELSVLGCLLSGDGSHLRKPRVSPGILRAERRGRIKPLHAPYDARGVRLVELRPNLDPALSFDERPK